MGKHLLFGFTLALASSACDADEAPAPTPTRPTPTASDLTPAVSGRATSENFQLDFAVSAMPSGKTATSENYELQIGGTQ